MATCIIRVSCTDSMQHNSDIGPSCVHDEPRSHSLGPKAIDPTGKRRQAGKAPAAHQPRTGCGSQGQGQWQGSRNRRWRCSCLGVGCTMLGLQGS